MRMVQQAKRVVAASYRFIVTGRVQGVWFRKETKQVADRLGLHGWVRNRVDGAVEGLVCGEESGLMEFRTWLHDGPSRATVEAVQWQPVPEAPDTGFAVRP